MGNSRPLSRGSGLQPEPRMSILIMHPSPTDAKAFLLAVVVHNNVAVDFVQVARCRAIALR
jgi:hypothetical protein